MKGLQPFLEDESTSRCRIFGFEPIHNFHLSIPNLKKCTSTYQTADAMRSCREKAVYERRPLGRMRTSIIRAVK